MRSEHLVGTKSNAVIHYGDPAVTGESPSLIRNLTSYFIMMERIWV